MPFSQFALISWILINVSSAQSPLTDPKVASCPSICLNESSHQEISNLKQLLNQESLIRLSLMKQVYSLVSDMITIKQRIAGVFMEGRQFEDKLEAMEKTIESLGNENQTLRTELEQTNITVINVTDCMTKSRDLLHANSSNAEGSNSYQKCVANVALGKSVSVSSTYSSFLPSNAVNGNFNDFMHTTYPTGEGRPWLTIDLGNIFLVHQIEIFNRADCCGSKFHDAEVTVGKSLDNLQFCGHYSGSARNGERIAMWCPPQTFARFVKIQIVKGTRNILHVAEVLIWGVPEGNYQYMLPSTNCLNNVALGKSVTVSTTYGKFRPSNAVNGYFNDFMHTTYPTGEGRPWLTIDLGNTFVVHQIEIFNRADCCGYKFHDADVKVGRSQSNLHTCGHYAGSAQNGERIVMTCPSRSIARFVKIQIVKGTRNVLHVAEVIVWGVRDTGRHQKTSK
ncbi:uncharacterized protein LOC125675409 [Ostrea edulis]|uniref:uncharacterized protein LOC125675409 n=1 Tax=Ostrea edulis TaxID=37623 RepID=UPI0024AF5403|nr:uncharacterized protein LOC125675409 [Ostrea edulis]